MQIDLRPDAIKQFREGGEVIFRVPSPTKGYWGWNSPTAIPDGFYPTITNIELLGGLPASMHGDAVFANSAYDASGAIMMAANYRATVGGALTQIIATSLGKVFKWSGAAWVQLRAGFSTTDWWSNVQYGSDIFIANPTDGVWRYSNDTLVPIGAKPINACEAETNWTNATLDTTTYKEGLGALKAATPSPGTITMTYNPAAVIDTATGRIQARTYLLTKATGTDCYHFWVKFEGAGTLDDVNTKVTITDTNAKSVSWHLGIWNTGKSTSSAFADPAATGWQEIFLFPVAATEVATFNPLIVDKIEFIFVTSAGTRTCFVDDIYSMYLTTMPAVQILVEWKNILFGMQSDTYYFSNVGAPDEFNVNAFDILKSDGEAIGGAARFFNQLTIGTEDHVFTLSGSVADQLYPAFLFDKNEVTDELGISSHRSIVKANNKLYWYWKGHKVEYTGTKADHISYYADAFFDDIDDTKAQFIVGAPERTKHQIWWTYRRIGQSVNDKIMRYNYQFEGFFPTTGLTTPIVLRTISSGAEKILTFNETSRLMYAQSDATNLTFSGTGIVSTIDLPAMFVEASATAWVMAWLQLLSGTGNLTVQYRQGDTLKELTDASYTTFETVNLALPGEYGKERIGDRATHLQVRLTTTGVYVQYSPPFIIMGKSLPASFTRVTP